MANLTIVAHITAKPESVDLVRAELLELIEPTRAEDGCVQYDLHQDDEDPTRFLFFENWSSREQWQVHMKSPHLEAFIAATDGAVADLAIQEMTQIG